MGCCSSDSKGKSGIETPSEEKVIRLSESITIFSRKKLKTLLSSIKAIDFQITPETIDKLYHVLHAPPSGPTSTFLARLVHKKILTPQILTLISILIAYPKKISKASLITSSNREECVQTIKLLLDLAVDIIPMNLEISDRSIEQYVEKLKAVCSQYKKDLDLMTLEKIHEKIAEMSISSADIRLNFYENYLRHKKMYKDKIRESIETTRSMNIMEFDTFNQDRNYGEIRLSVSPDFNIEDSDVSRKVSESPLNLDSPLLREYYSGDNLVVDRSFENQCALANSMRKKQIINDIEIGTTPRNSEYLSPERPSPVFNMQMAQFTRRMSEINKQNIKTYWKESSIKSKIPRKSEGPIRNLEFFDRLKGSRSPTGTQDSSPEKPARPTKNTPTVNLDTSTEKVERTLKKSLTGIPRYGGDKPNFKKLSIDSLKDFPTEKA